MYYWWCAWIQGFQVLCLIFTLVQCRQIMHWLFMYQMSPFEFIIIYQYHMILYCRVLSPGRWKPQTRNHSSVGKTQRNFAPKSVKEPRRRELSQSKRSASFMRVLHKLFQYMHRSIHIQSQNLYIEHFLSGVLYYRSWLRQFLLFLAVCNWMFCKHIGVEFYLYNLFIRD